MYGSLTVLPPNWFEYFGNAIYLLRNYVYRSQECYIMSEPILKVHSGLQPEGLLTGSRSVFNACLKVIINCLTVL